MTYVSIAADGENAITELAAVDFGADGPHATEPLRFAFDPDAESAVTVTGTKYHVILNQETVSDESGKAVGVKVTGTYGDDNALAAELTVNLDGSWSFAQHVPFAHAEAGDVGLDDLLEEFGLGALIVKDGDGDTVNFTLSFQLGDAGPSFAEGADSHTLQGLEGLVIGTAPGDELTYV